MANPVAYVKPDEVLQKGKRYINGEIWEWEICRRFSHDGNNVPYIGGDVIATRSEANPYGNRYGIVPNFDTIQGKPTERQRIRAIQDGIEMFFAQQGAQP